MDNYAIADQLSLLSRIMDIHGENSFKSKSYASAAFALEKLPQPVAGLTKEKICAIRGIGDSVGSKIMELLESGSLAQLQEYLLRTPAGVLEMLQIKGLGPKKIHTIWKEMHIDSIEALRTACAENRISEKKGFGAKTQQNILDAIDFQQAHAGKHLYAQLAEFAEAFTLKLKDKFPGHQTEITGAFRRQLEIIESLDWVTTVSSEDLQHYLLSDTVQLVADRDGMLILNLEQTVLLRFYITDAESFGRQLFESSCSEDFLHAFEKEHAGWRQETTEAGIFAAAQLPYIPPFLREKASFLQKAGTFAYDDLVETAGIKGLIHAHSNWSDGAHTLEEMAEALIRLGFEYLVISDHSKAAYYANGLTEARIREQHNHIDALNRKLAPFRIFKSIECDILNDGALDYDNKVLSTFDLVITSVHSNLDMDEEKAMRRLLGAIANPYTTILGHMTGRLLLRRKGYPVNHKTIIDACVAHGVAIEINASPSRLDIDWRWVDDAMEKGLMLSINPDAHTIDEFRNIRYGVMMGQKGGLTKQRNLSSLTLGQFEAYLESRKQKRGIM